MSTQTSIQTAPHARTTSLSAETFSSLPNTFLALNRDPKHELLKAFRLLDDYGTDKNFIKNLKCVAKELGNQITKEELQELIISGWISERSLGTTSS